MSTFKSEVRRDDDKLYTLIFKLAMINEQLRETRRLDKKRLLKAKSKHVNVFLKTIQLRDENVSRSMRLINRYQRILRRKQPSLSSKLSMFLRGVTKPFTRVIFKFTSFFSVFSPPPSSFAKNWSFTEEELYLWSKKFSSYLIGRVKENSRLLSNKAKMDIDRLRLNIKKSREDWKEKSNKMLCKASLSLKKGKEVAFKYMK